MHITIIAKRPVPGRVKTRLCPPCTPHQAAAVARAGLLDTIDAIDAAMTDAGDLTRVLLLDGEVEGCAPPGWRVLPQRGDGLGERLCNGFLDLGPGIVVGMETPHVAHLLPRSADVLAGGRDLLGRATDGGYWSIGLCASTVARAVEVFDGVEMSTSRTGAEQLRRLGTAGRSTALLPEARDLDDYADLCAVAASGRGGRLGAIAREIVDATDHRVHGRNRAED